VVWRLKEHKSSPPAAPTKSIAAPVTNPANVTVDGYQFYASPKKLGNLNFFADTATLFGTACSTPTQTTNCPPLVTPSQIAYYQIGMTPTNLPIVVASNWGVAEASFAYVAIQTSGGHYSIIGQLSGDLDPSVPADIPSINTLNSALSPGVTLDTADTIPPLSSFPTSTTVGGETISLPSDYSGPSGYFITGLSGIRGPYFNTPVKPSDLIKIGTQGGITYYEAVASDKSDYQVREIYGAIGGIYAASYVPVDPLTGSTYPAISWRSGTSYTTSTYTSASSGCGSANGYVVSKGVSPSDLTVAGTGPGNETIYDLPLSSQLFKDYYAEYGTGSGLTDSSLQNLSTTAFQNAHAVIVAKNALGDYVVYERTDMFIGGGCGKPVIYLYPTTKAVVNVSVGAKISKSTPDYGANGWRGVLATPNGQLTYNGKPYSSLYWEGQGLGSYPLITSGTVVPRSEAVSTIKTQLHEQGLNPEEIADFIAYWEPKLPDTPYVRLSWLNTAQMNQLAPLNINPRPATLIRVFLDFEGLNYPISLPPQTLTAPARHGFTVVEWGGLLRGQNTIL
jgi:hypothetical protein